MHTYVSKSDRKKFLNIILDGKGGIFLKISRRIKKNINSFCKVLVIYGSLIYFSLLSVCEFISKLKIDCNKTEIRDQCLSPMWLPDREVYVLAFPSSLSALHE
jgi:hypothetical protein